MLRKIAYYTCCHQEGHSLSQTHLFFNGNPYYSYSALSLRHHSHDGEMDCCPVQKKKKETDIELFSRPNRRETTEIPTYKFFEFVNKTSKED